MRHGFLHLYPKHWDLLRAHLQTYNASCFMLNYVYQLCRTGCKCATDARCRAATVCSPVQDGTCPSTHGTGCGLGAWRRSLCHCSTGCYREAVDHGGSRSCTCLTARSKDCKHSSRASTALVHRSIPTEAFLHICWLQALHHVRDCMQAQRRSHV